MPLPSYAGTTAKTRISPVSPSPLQKPTRSEAALQAALLRLGFLWYGRELRRVSLHRMAVFPGMSVPRPLLLHTPIPGHFWESSGICLRPSPISLPRAANDSLQARNSGGRMIQSGRQLPDAVKFRCR